MPTYLCAKTVFVMFAVAGWIWPAPVSRFIILVTGMLFYRSRNTRLTGELLTELPGILNWTLDGIDGQAPDRLRQRRRPG